MPCTIIQHVFLKKFRAESSIVTVLLITCAIEKRILTHKRKEKWEVTNDLPHVVE